MMDSAMLFDNWSTLGRTAAIGVCAYLALIILLRVSGKRILSKMNAFDFIVTIALGSTLASLLTSKETALAQGVLALSLLVALQWIIAWLSVRSRLVNRLVKSEPKLLFLNGEFLRQAMRDERVNEGELLQAMRSQGVSRVESIAAGILETDGSFSIVKDARHGFSTFPTQSRERTGSPLEAGSGPAA